MGALISVAIGIGIAYGHLLGISFLLIMPISLIVGVVVGSMSSLCPIGPTARPMLDAKPAPPASAGS